MNVSNRPPLLTPNQVSLLTDQLAKLHGAIADADRIEQCGFECGDIRATLQALSITISNMLQILGNVPSGMVPQMAGQQAPVFPLRGGSGLAGGAPVIRRTPTGFEPVTVAPTGSPGSGVVSGSPIPPGGHALGGQQVGPGYE